MAAEVGTAYISILPETAKLAGAIRKELGVIESEAPRSGDRAGKGFASRFAAGAGRALTGFVKGGLLAGITGASLLGGAGIKTAAELEQSRIGFETMLGSTQKADKFLAQIKSTAAKTPFELPGLTQSAQKLLAFGFDVKDVIPTLTTLGDAASGLGVGQEGLDRITMAVGQMQAKGKVSSEELLQLTESGIPALKILANEYGVTTAKMQEDVTKGVVKTEKAIPALLKGIREGSSGAAGETAKFGGLMEKQSQSMTGLFSTLKDTVLVGMAEAITPLIPSIKSGLGGAISAVGPAMDGLATGLQKGTTFAKGFVAEWKAGTGAGGTFRDVVGGIGTVLGTIVSVGVGVISFFNQHRSLLVVLAGVYATLTGVVLAYNLAQKATAAGGLVAMITGWVKGLQIYSTVTKVATAVQWAWNAAMSANPIALVVLAIAALVAGLIYAWRNSETFRTIVISAWTAIKVAATAVFGAVRDFIVSAWNRIKSATSSVWNGIKSALSATFNFLKGVFLNFTGPGLIIKHWNTIKTVTSATWAAIKSLVSGAIDGVKGAINGIQAVVGTVTNAFERVRNAISDKITAAIDIVRGLPGRALSALGNVGSTLYNAGTQIIQGLINGVTDKIGALTSKLQGVTKMLPKWKGPPDTDKKILRPNGRLIMDGLLKGIDDGIPKIKRVLKDLTKELPKGGAKALRKIAADEYRDAVLFAKKRQKAAEVLEEKKGLLKAAIDLRDDFKKSVKESASAWAGIGSVTVQGEEVLNADTIVEQMRKRLQAIRDFTGNLKTLVSQGLDPVSYQQIASQGVDAGGALAAALVQNPAATLAVADLSRQIVSASDLLGQDTSTHLHQAGVDGAQAVVDGLQIDQQKMDEKADNMARQIAEALKKAFPKIRLSVDDLIPGDDAPKKGNGGGKKGGQKGGQKKGGKKGGASASGGWAIYDNGGILEPGALAYNASKKPEAVFNHRQFAQYAADAAGSEEKTQKVFNYYAAEGTSLGSEEDLFAAVSRSRMVGF